MPPADHQPPDPDATWVRQFDADNEWMAGLDWSRHRRRGGDYVSDRLMLASVVEILAQHLCAPMPEGVHGFIAQAGNTPSRGLVEAEEAYAPDGTPLHSVHARFGAVVRRLADEHGVAIAASDAISISEWHEVVTASADACAIGEGARRAVSGLAPVLASLAATDALRCHARPLGGGAAAAPIGGREWWDVDPEVAIARIATCGLNLRRPFDVSAPIDHLIFVDRTNVQNVAIQAARTNYVPVVALEYGPWLLKRPVDYYAVQTEEVASFLVARMDSGECEAWTNGDFQNAVAAEFGQRGLGRCYERAKALAIADDEPDPRRSRSRFGRRRPATP